MQTAVKLYSQDTYSGLYINKFNDSIFYDQNLKNMDTYNYKLVSEIYNSGISVMMECEKNLVIQMLCLHTKAYILYTTN